MGSYTLSEAADEDIEAIARSSLEQWGVTRAEMYVLGLHAAFERLAEFPDLGRDANVIHPGYRRIETGRHVVFYRPTGHGVLIVRVLHDRMDFRRHL